MPVLIQCERGVTLLLYSLRQCIKNCYTVLPIRVNLFVLRPPTFPNLIGVASLLFFHVFERSQQQGHQI
jgi:hypothetical protein